MNPYKNMHEPLQKCCEWILFNDLHTVKQVFPVWFTQWNVFIFELDQIFIYMDNPVELHNISAMYPAEEICW